MACYQYSFSKKEAGTQIRLNVRYICRDFLLASNCVCNMYLLAISVLYKYCCFEGVHGASKVKLFPGVVNCFHKFLAPGLGGVVLSVYNLNGILSCFDFDSK